jgi:hypothetical protein
MAASVERMDGHVGSGHACEQAIDQPTSHRENASRASRKCLHEMTSRQEVRDGASRVRTGDLLLAKQALSQLSYGPARCRV